MARCAYQLYSTTGRPALPAARIDWITFSMSASLPGPVVDRVREARRSSGWPASARWPSGGPSFLAAALSSHGMRAAAGDHVVDAELTDPSCRRRRLRRPSRRSRVLPRGRSSVCPGLRSGADAAPQVMGSDLAGSGIASAAAPTVFSIVRREYMVFIGGVPHGRQPGCQA